MGNRIDRAKAWAKDNPGKSLFVAWLTPIIPPPGPFGTDMNLKEASKDLVERARLGDQNAMATLVEIRKAAQQGNHKAMAAFSFLKQYIQRNPPGSKHRLSAPNRQAIAHLKTAVAAEDVEMLIQVLPTVGKDLIASNGAAVVMANGPKLDKPRLTLIAEALGEKFKKAFITGFRLGGEDEVKVLAPKVPPEERGALQIGWAVGLARKIQAVRIPGIPLAVLSKDVAWELGE